MTLLPLPQSSTKLLFYLPADAVSLQCVYKKQHSVCMCQTQKLHGPSNL